MLIFREGILLLRKMTFSKFWNFLLLRFSYSISRILRKPVMFGNPMAISVEPTTACNLQCPECPSGLRAFTRPVGSLGFDPYVRMIETQHKALWYLNLYFQGEPYLNKDFFRMISIAHKKGIFTATSTNGHYLDDINAKNTVLSGLDKLIVSVDGADQETYERYRRGGNLKKVMDGIMNVNKWKLKLKKRTPLVVVQFIIFRFNQHQMDQIRQAVSDAGADHLQFKTAQIYDYPDKAYMIPDNPAFSRYRLQQDGSYGMNGSQSAHCWRMWSSSVITWDGRILPCCFDKDASHQLGMLGPQNFHEIWTSEKYKRFRQKILRSRKEMDICTNCTEGSRTWA
jgi:radical SAM protein with 4Fe4S-binding SPASM domain